MSKKRIELQTINPKNIQGACNGNWFSLSKPAPPHFGFLLAGKSSASTGAILQQPGKSSRFSQFLLAGRRSVAKGQHVLTQVLPSLLRARLPGKGFVLALTMRLDAPIVGFWTRVNSNLLQHNRWLCLDATLCRQLRASRLHSPAATNLALSFGFSFSFRPRFGFRLLGRWSLLRQSPRRASLDMLLRSLQNKPWFGPDKI